MRRAVAVLCVCLAGCSRSSPSPAFKPVADVKGMMSSILDPQADIVWESVGTIITAEGTTDRRPRTAQEWTAVANAATVLAESGNLLMMAPRAKDGGDWMKYSRDLIDVSEQAIQAAQARDAGRIYEIGGDINEKCMQCHEHYDPTVLRDLGKIR